MADGCVAGRVAFLLSSSQEAGLPPRSSQV